ncbi:MAG: prephenate dehydratase [Actinobacteria bacterium]|nr:prephenate dehydratase [Actinomycetota bacterium]
MSEPLPAVRPNTIAFLGPPGTFSEEALRNTLGESLAEVRLVPKESNRDVVMAVENGETDAAFVPIENSVEGAVTETLDALVHEAPNTYIAGELVWPVHHCLIAGDDLTLDQVTSVASHPQALGQCTNFINSELPGAQRLNSASTAEAVREAIAAGNGAAAIGSRIAADSYGGRVIAEAVEDVEGNTTRFVWLAQGTIDGDWIDDSPSAPRKTSIVFSGFNDTSPGALVGILSELAYRSVNMSKIESRPERTTLGHYLFFADLDGSTDDVPLADALTAIRGKVRELRVLGSFPTSQA